MAAISLKTKILDRIGEAESGDLGLTAVILSGLLDDITKTIIISMPEEVLEFMGKQETAFVPATGIAVSNTQVIHVYRNDGTYDRRCEQVPGGQFRLAAERGSFYEASNTWPVYTVEGQTTGVAKIKVAPTSASAIGKVIQIKYPECDSNAIGIDGFPDELEPVAIVGVCGQVYLRAFGVATRDSQDELEAITVSGYLASFESALPAFVAPSPPTMPTLTLTAMDALPTLTFTDATDSWPTLTLSPSITLPTLTMPAGITLPTLTLTAAPAFTDLVIPPAPTNTLVYKSAGGVPVGEYSPTQGIPSYDGPVGFSYSRTDVTDALDKAKTLIDAGATAGGDSAAAGLSFQTAIIATHLDSARVSLDGAAQEVNRANAAMSDQQVDLQRFSNEVSEATGKLSSEITAYSAEVSKLVQTASGNLSAYSSQLQDNQNDLSEQVSQYQTDVSKYQAAVNAATSEWSAEEVQFKLAKWNNQVQSEIGEYSAKANALSAEYRDAATSILNEYQALVDAQIKNYTAIVQAETAEYNATVNAYLNEVKTFRDSELGEYQAKVNTAINEYNAINQITISEFQANEKSVIDEYTALLNTRGQEFTNGLSEARAHLEEAQVRLQTMQSFDAKAKSALEQAKEFNKLYDQGLSRYLSRFEQKEKDK